MAPSSRRLSLLTAGLLVAGGCRPSASRIVETDEVTDRSCATDGTCLKEQQRTCETSAGCSDGLACKAGRCSACAEDFDCQPGVCDIGTGRCVAAELSGCTCISDDGCSMDDYCDGCSCVSLASRRAPGPSCELKAVYFDREHARLAPGAEQQLAAAAECMKQLPGEIVLEAHADLDGTEEYSILVTRDLGQLVKDFLIAHGVVDEKLIVVPMGALEAAADGAHGGRVEFDYGT